MQLLFMYVCGTLKHIGHPKSQSGRDGDEHARLFTITRDVGSTFAPPNRFYFFHAVGYPP